jgi:peroxiredoxin
MSEIHTPRVGQRLPPVVLGELQNGELRRVPLERLLAGRRALIIGVPGAFTPVCSQRHVPDFVSKADALKALGFDLLVCISPNDPWAVAAWAEQIDPEGRLRFLSDGNMEFARETGLVELHPDLFLGERLKRFVITLKDAVVDHIGIETDILTVGCSRSEDVVLAA